MECFQDATNNELNLYKKQLSELKNKREKLEERFAFGEIDKQLFSRYVDKVDQDIRKLSEKYEVPNVTISNLENKIDLAVEFSQNISKSWQSGSLEVKKGIQNLLFPEGIILDTKNRRYLTSRVNALFVDKLRFTVDSEGLKKNSPSKMMGSPLL